MGAWSGGARTGRERGEAAPPGGARQTAVRARGAGRTERGRARGWVQTLRLCSKLIRGHWLEERSHTLRKGRRCTLELGHSWVTQSSAVAESEVAPETAGEVHSY